MQRIRELLNAPEPIKWLFTGDSITEGALHTFGYRDYTQHFSERLRHELNRRHDVVINTGISGHTTREVLDEFDWRVAQFAPRVAFVMLGTNDCAQGMALDTFTANLNEIGERIESSGILPVMQTTNLMCLADAAHPLNAQPQFMDAVREVAKSHGWLLVDHAAFWVRHIEEQPGRLQFWLSDYGHPNQFGHTALAHCLFETLDIFDRQANTCRFFCP